MEHDESIEELEKAAHYWKDKDPKKYKQMLGKLKNERNKPGSKERAYQQVLQAKRRERGGAGTKAGSNGSKGHSKNRMKSDTATAVGKYKSSEKKAGTKLSPDRKNNSEGYGSGNVRNVPQKLNRGRHHVDQKKLSQWKKKLKKMNISYDDFKTLLTAKASETGHDELAKSLLYIDYDILMAIFDDQFV
jgi:hypothetical protein